MGKKTVKQIIKLFIFLSYLLKRVIKKTYLDTVTLETKGFLSERHHGLYKMFSRVVRPVWQTAIVEEAKISEEGRTRTYVGFSCNFLYFEVYFKTSKLTLLY